MFENMITCFIVAYIMFHSTIDYCKTIFFLSVVVVFSFRYRLLFINTIILFTTVYSMC